MQLTRITFAPEVMGGKPCIRNLRVTVGMIVGLLATGHSEQEVLQLYPYLESEDLREALAYAAWRAEEIEVPLALA
ncbi:MAG: DUF433 domain-containing protein [Acidobacteriota bacterium]|nr:DUF433 domain-containing protein [Acidobacteriota bacterium]